MSTKKSRKRKCTADKEIGMHYVSETGRRRRGEVGRPEDNILKLACLIQEGKNVVFVSGAGLSVASGIAPFRGQHDAVWEQSVHTWGTRQKFEENPVVWYNTFWLKHFDETKIYQPNEGHGAIAHVCSLFPNTKVITQNIDRLHSGIPKEQLIEVHGFAGAFKCFTEECPYSYEKLVYGKSTCDISSTQHINKCPECKQVMCPNCLLFDEDYTDHESYQFEKSLEWLKDADAIVFVGTSFAVKITDIAFGCARSKVPHGTIFNFNLSDNISKSKVSRTKIHFIEGKSEETLPKLNEILKVWHEKK